MFASIYSESLIKTTCQHLLLLVGFDTLIYQKYYDTPPILLGHQASPVCVVEEEREKEASETGQRLRAKILVEPK
jgi:hypothetical protein